MSERLPSQGGALRLLVQSGCTPRVIRHCKAVAALALQFAKACKESGLNVDIQLVQIGALLHDIGRSRTHSIDHVVIGAEIAKSLNLPESVMSIIARHAGGGITTDEAKKLGWPIKCYIPQSLEERIVTYADKLIEGSRRVEIERTIEKLSRELGDTHHAIKRVRQLHEELSFLVGNSCAHTHIA